MVSAFVPPGKKFEPGPGNNGSGNESSSSVALVVVTTDASPPLADVISDGIRVAVVDGVLMELMGGMGAPGFVTNSEFPGRLPAVDDSEPLRGVGSIVTVIAQQETKLSILLSMHYKVDGKKQQPEQFLAVPRPASCFFAVFSCIKLGGLRSRAANQHVDVIIRVPEWPQPEQRSQ